MNPYHCTTIAIFESEIIGLISYLNFSGSLINQDTQVQTNAYMTDI